MIITVDLNDETSEIIQNLAAYNKLDGAEVLLGLMQVGIDCLGVGWEATFLYNSEREDIARTIFEDKVRFAVSSDLVNHAKEARSERTGDWSDAVRGEEQLVYKH